MATIGTAGLEFGVELTAGMDAELWRGPSQLEAGMTPQTATVTLSGIQGLINSYLRQQRETSAANTAEVLPGQLQVCPHTEATSPTQVESHLVPQQ